MKSYKYMINGNPYGVTIKQMSDDQAVVDVNGMEYHVDIIEEPIQRKTPKLVRQHVIPTSEKRPIQTKAAQQPIAAGKIKAPLPGLILEVSVKEGDSVSLGQNIIKMEAMKMENNIQSNLEGTINKIHVKSGDSVLEGDVLAEIGG